MLRRNTPEVESKERKNKMIKQLIPYNMYEFLEKMKIFDPNQNIIDTHNIEFDDTTPGTYLKSGTKFKHIIGTFKSVDLFFTLILRLMKINYEEDDENLHSDKISWPKHYLDCLKLKGEDIDKYKNIEGSTFYNQISKVEDLIKEIKYIHYPPEWNLTNLNKT